MFLILEKFFETCLVFMYSFLWFFELNHMLCTFTISNQFILIFITMWILIFVFW